MIEQFNLWNLKDNPFLPLPPQNETIRHRVFVGRQTEIQSILARKNRAQGIFIVGMFGIGKSMLALEMLWQMRRTHKTAYVKFKKNLGLANSVVSKLEDDIVVSNDPIMKLEKKFKQLKLRKPLVVVVDDLDKDTDLGDMQNIILEARQIIEVGYLVILLGHPVGVTAELSSAHDILYPIPLPNLSKNELTQMVGNYLATSRTVKYDGEPLYPFTSDMVELLAEIISDYALTPRILNHACRLLLDQAATDKISIIDISYFQDRWSYIAKSCLESLHQEDREYFRKIHAAGSLSEDTRKLIKDIGGPFAEYGEVRKVISNLIQNDILIEKNNSGIREISTNPFYDIDKLINIFR